MSNAQTIGLEGNSTNSEKNTYRDIRFPWIEYIGFKRKPGTVRNIWYVRNTQNNDERGPFPSRKVALAFVHGELELPQYTSSTNGNSVPVETGNDQIIEFSCPHCGRGIQGLLARK